MLVFRRVDPDFVQEIPKEKRAWSFTYELQVASFPGDELFWSTILV